MKFTDLNLIEPLLRALEQEGYTTPTPIQQQAIPILLEGQDLLGCAQTGTGKTAAFVLPILQQLQNQKLKGNFGRGIKTLILTPTRELAIQIDESIEAYGKFLGFRHLVIFGGVGQQPQVDAIRRGVDILVATPGRLLDLIGQKLLSIEQIQFFVLDEADRMLDMGFIHDVKRVIALLPKQRQSLFFSATMPPEVTSIANLMLTDPASVAVTPVSSTAETVEQSVFFVQKNDKRALLAHVLEEQRIPRALVFTRTKHGADRVAKDLKRAGIPADSIHGDKAQNARQKALNQFKDSKIRVLVATDIAARGIDVDDLTHVINFEIPNIPETYVHRIGRTGRAGASGTAISFCDDIEGEYLRDIQKLIGKKVPVVEAHPYPMPMPEILLKPLQPVQKQPVKKQNQPQQRQQQRPQGQPQRDVTPTSRSVQPQQQNQPRLAAEPRQAPAQNFQKERNQGENRQPQREQNQPRPAAQNFQKEKNLNENQQQREQNQQRPAQNFQKNKNKGQQKQQSDEQKSMLTEVRLKPHKQAELKKEAARAAQNPEPQRPQKPERVKQLGNQRLLDRTPSIQKPKPVQQPIAKPQLTKPPVIEDDLDAAEQRKNRLKSFGGLFKNKF